ncbi:MAG: TolC family protein [Crocinitomicaceae bacterium]
MKVAFIILIFCPFLSFGQTKWMLQDCIDSALINNPEMQLSDLDLSIAEINAKSEKLNYLPSLSGNASHGYNWGQTIDPFTNSFASDRVRYNNFYLSSSVTLFSGLQNYYESKIASIDQEIILANKQVDQRNLTLEIIGAYLQVKLNEEIVSLNRKHLTYSQEQARRARLLEDLEFETKRRRLESEAQETNDQYELVQSENDLKRSTVLLQMLIGREPDTLFLLADSISLVNKPIVDETQVDLLQAQRNLLQSKQLKGRFSPSLTLNGALGSGYSENNQFTGPDGSLIPKPFGNQINENFYQSVFVNLSIPIFNGTSSYADIKVNEKEYERVQIESRQRATELTNSKLQNRLEVENQRTALNFAQISFESYQLLFDESSMQYDNGAISYYDYLQNKDAFLNAESELIQAKYRLRFAEMVNDMF